MSRLLQAATAALIVLLSASRASADPPKASDVPKEDPAQALAFNTADALVKAHQPQAAIDKLNSIIAYYDRTYRGSKVLIYCGHSSTESLLYLLNASAAKRSAVVFRSTWADALAEKAYMLVDLGRPAEAKPFYEAALALSPDYWAYLAELGHIAQLERDWPKSLVLFNRVDEAAAYADEVDLVKAKTRSLRGKGYTLVELGRLDEAEAAYRKALALDPHDQASAGELAYVMRQKVKRTSPST